MLWEGRSGKFRCPYPDKLESGGGRKGPILDQSSMASHAQCGNGRERCSTSKPLGAHVLRPSPPLSQRAGRPQPPLPRPSWRRWAAHLDNEPHIRCAAERRPTCTSPVRSGKSSAECTSRRLEGCRLPHGKALDQFSATVLDTMRAPEASECRCHSRRPFRHRTLLAVSLARRWDRHVPAEAAQ
jgi:hypothetical protein